MDGLQRFSAFHGGNMLHTLRYSHGFPVWWYVAPTIINTFLESYDLTGKTIIPFATSGGSGMGKTNEKLQPSCPNSKLIEGKAFKKSASNSELAAWADGLKL